MSTTLERRPDLLPRFSDWFDDKWFDLPDWFRVFDRTKMAEMIRVEETYNKDHLMIRAEMPGIDPDKDVEITISDGLLTIVAERREEEKTEKDDRTTSEFRYGSFRRTLRVPKDAKTTDVKANYKDGILTISVPLPKATPPAVAKVSVSRN